MVSKSVYNNMACKKNDSSMLGIEFPLVTYLTVVLNAVGTISRTIESVSSQEYSNIEYIIVDGGSEDGTLDVIRDNLDKIDHYISEKDSGIYNAFNKGLSLAHGDIICFVNADDWLLPEAAGVAVNKFKNCSELSVLFSGAVVSDDSRGVYVWAPRNVTAGSYFTCANVCHNAMYVRRQVYDKIGNYDDNFKIAGDFEWIMRCFDNNINFVYADDVTVNYSVGGMSSDVATHCLESMTIAKRRFSFLEREDIEKIFWCYFDSFETAKGRLRCGRSVTRVSVINHLLQKYSNDSDFVEAIAWASMEKMIHPLDVNTSFCIKMFLKKIINPLKEVVLYVSPSLFKMLKRMREKHL